MEFLEKILKKRNQKRARRVSKFLKDHIKKSKCVLDVGSGNGTILKQIRKDLNVKIQGIDITVAR